MLAASVIPPQEWKSFHLFLLKHLNVDLNKGASSFMIIWFENWTIPVTMDMVLFPT